jgi:hypothetical protein
LSSSSWSSDSRPTGIEQRIVNPQNRNRLAAERDA